MQDISIADELALLGLGDRLGGYDTVDVGMGAAAAGLYELNLLGRLTIEDTITVRDATPTGHPVLDPILAALTDPREPAMAVSLLASDARRAVMPHLVRLGLVREGFRGRYPGIDGRPALVKEEAIQRVRELATASGPLAKPDRTAALGAFVSALGWDRRIVRRRAARARLAECRDTNWAATALHTALGNTNANLTRSTGSSTSTGTGTGGF